MSEKHATSLVAELRPIALWRAGDLLKAGPAVNNLVVTR